MLFHRNVVTPLLCVLALMHTSAVNAFDWNACDEEHRFPAEAFERESGKLLYTESHRQCRVAGQLRYALMEYHSPDGDALARKWLDYRQGAATPDFQLEDLRSGYSEGARRKGDRVELNRRMTARAKTERNSFSVPDNAVIDSGFDEFVRANIDRLRDGKTVRLKFLVAGELDRFSFKAHGLEKTRWQGRDAFHLRVEHDSFLVRMLLAPILLWYDAESLRLLEYQGISNIKSARGDRYDARIVYPPESRRVERVVPAKSAPAPE